MELVAQQKPPFTVDWGSVNRKMDTLSKNAAQFQIFLDELIRLGIEVSYEEFRDLLVNKSDQNRLSILLKKCTLKNTPALQELPIKLDYKLEMIEIEEKYNHLISIYNDLPSSQNILDRINRLEIKDGKIIIPKRTKDAIIDSSTKYKKHTEEYFKDAEVAVFTINMVIEKHGVCPIKENLIQWNDDSGKWEIKKDDIAYKLG